ncbi:MAG: transposase, partial [Pirellulaceae bacterium]|nr:transposase [Pirellulaceae bacterium]
GIGSNLLRKWREKFAEQGQEAFPGKGKLTATDEEMRELREECRRLRMERDILKSICPFWKLIFLWILESRSLPA